MKLRLWALILVYLPTASVWKPLLLVSDIVMESSGRPSRFPNPTKFAKLDLSSEVDALSLLRSIAKSTSIVATGTPVAQYKPLYRHPLPVSKHRYEHECVIKKIMSCPLEKQVAAAVVSRDAHTLEEVYMRGAPVDTRNPINGFTPLHLAVQNNSIECVMLLLHIGVDIDAVSFSGATPLYLAGARDAREVKMLLLERGAKLEVEKKQVCVHTSTVLTYKAPNVRAAALTLSEQASRRPTAMATRHASY